MMKRLGDYIRPVDTRNRDLSVQLSQGICNNKYFVNPKQVAENPETHKVVRTGQFAYNKATTRNGEKISIALRQGPDCTVSSAYQIFEIVDENILDPEYLMMWFRRPIFDRYARFKSHGSAHEFFEWESMCEVLVPIPSIEKQREIVAEYNTLQNRIETNKKLIATLEQTAQTLYRHTFVDNIDPNNLPAGWRMGVFTDLVKLGGGGTPSTTEPSFWKDEVLFFTPADVDSYYTINTMKKISKEGLASCSSKLYEKNTTFVTARGTVGAIGLAGSPMAMNQSCFALLPKQGNHRFYIHQLSLDTMNSLKEEAIGAVFNALTSMDFQKKTVTIPPSNLISKFDEDIAPVYSNILIKQAENQVLNQMQSLLLSKMGV